MYNNIGKRDILIFPKFDNMKIIDKIRNKYDRLSNLVAPHITLAFPFKDKISNEDLISKLSALLKKHSHFEVTFKGISLSDDNYILLNCVKGNYEILKLHDDIYEKIIPSHFKKIKEKLTKPRKWIDKLSAHFKCNPLKCSCGNTLKFQFIVQSKSKKLFELCFPNLL